MCISNKVQSKYEDGCVCFRRGGRGRNERLGFNYILSILFFYLKKNRDLKQIWRNVNICLTWQWIWVPMTLFSLCLKCFITKN